MNCEMQEDVKLRLSFEGFGSMEGIAWRELYDDDPYAKNTFDEEFRVVPRKRAGGRIGRRNGSYLRAFLECAALEAEITQAAH